MLWASHLEDKRYRAIAWVLLDKWKLVTELIPAINRYVDSHKMSSDGRDTFEAS